MSDGLFVTLEILECKACGRLVFAVADPRGFGTRLSGHKCAGAWTSVLSEEFPLDKIASEAYEATAWKKADPDVKALIKRCPESQVDG